MAGCQRAIAEQIVTKGADYLLLSKVINPACTKRLSMLIDRKDELVRRASGTGARASIVAQRSILPATGIVSANDWPERKTWLHVLIPCVRSKVNRPNWSSGITLVHEISRQSCQRAFALVR